MSEIYSITIYLFSLNLESSLIVMHYIFIETTIRICFWQVKWPNGKKFEDVFLDTLKKHDYRGSYLSKSWLKQPCFIQSFAPTSLVYIQNKTDLPKIFLIGDTAWRTEDTNQVSNLSFSFIVLLRVG